MAHIVETIVADRRLQLGNEAYCRLMRIGANWLRIRIGVRFSINGRSDIPNCSLSIGVAVDQNSTPAADRSNGCCGFHYIASGASNATFNAAQLNNSFYNLLQNGIYAFNKLDNVTTYTAMALSNNTPYIGATPCQPGALFGTLQRAGSVIQPVDSLYLSTPAKAQAGLTVTQFYQAMESETASAVPALTRSTHSQTAMTTSAPFPYVFVRWAHSVPTLEITHIAVTRFF